MIENTIDINMANKDITLCTKKIDKRDAISKDIANIIND